MKVIIWGHKLHSHTHSYIHAAFYKAFSFMGYETYWLDSSYIKPDMTFTDCLFLTEGQVDGEIPLHQSNKYILHNCNLDKYNNFSILNLQVYSNGFENSLGVSGTKIEECTYFDNKIKTLYQPWATDLLPSEIVSDFTFKNNKTAVWIGSIWGGYHGNIQELNNFSKSLEKYGYIFSHLGCSAIDFSMNVKYIQDNELAPAIVGTWQNKNGYIPCRIFKNVSYGQLGITNSKTVFDLLEENVICENNCVDLIETYLSMSLEQKTNLFKAANLLIKNKHTYLNRIDKILTHI